MVTATRKMQQEKLKFECPNCGWRTEDGKADASVSHEPAPESKATRTYRIVM